MGETDVVAQVMEADRAFAAAVAAAGPADRAEVWAGWFAEDGRQVVPGAVVVGHGPIKELMGPAFASPDYELRWDPDQGGGGDSVAWTSGRYTSVRRGDRGEAVTASGRYVTIWSRQADGSWKVALDTGVPD